jgi:hypothetical protein
MPTAWFVGAMDRRPNAFVGSRLRVLGSVNDILPATVLSPWFPPQERRIQTYDVYDGLAVGVRPNFDAGVLSATSTWANWNSIDRVVLTGDVVGRTYLLYEVLPDLDIQLLLVAALMTALEIATLCTNAKKAAALVSLLKTKKRGLVLKWTNQQTITSIHMDTTSMSVEDWSGFTL